MSDTIDLTVLDDMRLAISPHEIGRDSEHNAATFKITQPAALDQYACRAEVRTQAGTTYRLVTGGEFSLTNDITVQGHGQIQLAYSDGTQVMKKTTLAPFHITESLNAVDPGAPGFGDGLAQLQGAAFAKAEIVATTLAFRNIGGTVVDTVVLPGGAEDLDINYVRRDGANTMDGSLLFSRANLGIVFDPAANGPIIYNDGIAMRFRRAAGNAEITVEDPSGAPATRSNVMTLAASDLRYLQLSGGVYPSTITFAAGQGFAFQPGSSAVQEQGGTLVARHGVGAFSPVITVNDGDARYVNYALGDARYLSQGGGTITGPITGVGMPTPDLFHLITRQWVESATLSLNGGQLSGILSFAPSGRLISAMGSGNNPTLCIGSNDSGFWRTGASVVFEVGLAATWIYSGNGTATYMPLTLAGAPTLNGHAANKQYVDERRAPTLKFDIPVDFPLTADWRTLYLPTYPIPRAGLNRVRVCVSASCRTSLQGGLSIVGISCQPDIALDRIERHVFVYNLSGVSSGFTAEFTVETNAGAPVLTIQAALLATNPANNDVAIIGGDTFNQERSQITISDLGPR